MSGPIPAGSPQVTAILPPPPATASVMGFRFTRAARSCKAAFPGREKFEKPFRFHGRELLSSKSCGCDLPDISGHKIDVMKRRFEFTNRVATNASAFQADEIKSDHVIALR